MAHSKSGIVQGMFCKGVAANEASEMKPDTFFGGTKYFGALFFSLVNVMFNGMAELAMTIMKLPVSYKQGDHLFYPAWAFALPIWVLRIPLSFMEFFRQSLALLGVHQMALSLFRFIAALGRTEVVSKLLGTFTLLMVFLLGGFIISKNDLEPWIMWGYYMSPMMYGPNALAVNEFLDKT
ncbi:hypothetical protein Pint_20837 [Pistacia integerrima]|uniref:Uncharacterized protein n=1 Tax=Pistacia integerrima TaxID=434235 RepID=A0ACC0XB34_9ROSI|nr:hypothetical protein Pint_20837 [Pistacia integerrima]